MHCNFTQNLNSIINIYEGRGENWCFFFNCPPFSFKGFLREASGWGRALYQYISVLRQFLQIDTFLKLLWLRRAKSGAASRQVCTITRVLEAMVAAVRHYVSKLIIRLRPSFLPFTWTLQIFSRTNRTFDFCKFRVKIKISLFHQKT